MCDAAYRDIQRASDVLEGKSQRSSFSDERITALFTSVIGDCRDIGQSMEALGRQLEGRSRAEKFRECLHRFTEAVCSVVVCVIEMANWVGGALGDRRQAKQLMLSARAIRHCACSVVTSARFLVSNAGIDHTVYTDHKRALSRALAELVNTLSCLYTDDQSSLSFNNNYPVYDAVNVR
jgi:hypothetical protein